MPGKTASRAKTRCSSAASRSYDHATVARKVCWRASASRPPREEIEPLREPLQQLARREHAGTRRRQLDRQREVVEPAAELLDRVVGSKPRAASRRAQRRRARRGGGPRTRPRRGRAAARGSSRAAAGSGRPRRATRAPARTRRPARGCRAAAAARARRCARLGRFSRLTTARSCRRTRPGSRSGASPTQKTPFLTSGTSSAAASIASRVLPEPPAPGERQQAHAVAEQRDHLRALPLSSDERARRPRQVRVRDRLQRRKPLESRAGRSRPGRRSPSAGARRGRARRRRRAHASPRR